MRRIGLRETGSIFSDFISQLKVRDEIRLSQSSPRIRILTIRRREKTTFRMNRYCRGEFKVLQGGTAINPLAFRSQEE